MRILKISDVYFPRINGVSTALRTLRRELEQQGHEVTLLAPSYVAEETPEQGVIRIPAKPIPFDPEDRRLVLRALLKQAYRLDGRFDLIHIHTPFVAHYAGTILARRLNLPCVLTYHTYFEEYLHHYIPLLPRKLLRFAARRFTLSQCYAVNAVIVPSKPMQQVLQDYGFQGNCHIIPTGIPSEHFQGGDGARFRACYGIPPQRPVLVHIGRVAHEKNITFLLSMLAELKQRIPDVLLIIAGEGPARASLQNLGENLSLQQNLLFVGYLHDRQNLHDCYRAGDLFVFASRTETQGLVLLEAMALEVPVVSTAVMGTKDILANCPGAVIAQETPEDFATQVEVLLKNPIQRRQLALAAKEFAGAWSVSHLVQQLTALYADTLLAFESRGRQTIASPNAQNDTTPKKEFY